MRRFRKRGLSPVIATVLLIVIAMVLASLIFFWARGVVKERSQKFGEAIELSCERVNFDAEFEGDGTIYLSNIGNVAIYDIDVRKVESGSIRNIGRGGFDNGVSVGDGKSTTESFSFDISPGDELVIVPIILGETDDYRKSHTCGEEFGIRIFA
jgi:flagellin-like protein